MRNTTNVGILFLVLALSLILTAFTVYETDRAIVLRLGQLRAENVTNGRSCTLDASMLETSAKEPVKKKEILGDCRARVLNPGLHFKMPFIDTVKTFDARILMLSIPSERIPTIEKKDVMVDLFVKWRINDFGLFYLRHGGDQHNAEALLRQKVIDGLRAAFGQRTIKEVVSGERQGVMENLRTSTSLSALDLGIQVTDVRIKRIDLPVEVSPAVYERMRTERERDATKLRALGAASAETLRAEAEKKVRVMLAEAKKTGETIRGTGDALAMQIYADTYNKSPEFFEFYKSLEAYKKSFNSKNDILVLKPDSDFFKYFRTKNISKEGQFVKQ